MTRLLQVEADGGSRGNPGPSAYGALVRDPLTGEILVEVAGHLGTTTNNVAEYTGLLEGLRAAVQFDAEAHVAVLMDSKLVVEQMSGRWAIKNDALRRIALVAREVLPRDRVSYSWIPREKNKDADRLANESMDAVERGRSGDVYRILVGDPVATSEVGDEALGPIAEEGPRPAIVGWGPDLGAPTITIMVRHGVTAHSLERRFSGSGTRGIDPPLVTLGISQAEAAARELVARGGADVIVSSPMLRTQQTATAISTALGLPLQTLEGLQECDFGEWEGATFAEVLERWPDQMALWLQSPEVAPPGGESAAQVSRRVIAAMDHVRSPYTGLRVVVVGHVGSIRCATAHALRAPLETMNRMELLPASLTTLTWYADGNASMRGFAESGHLQGLTPPWTP